MEEKEFTFETKEQYEKRLEEMVRDGDTLTFQGTERYDELLDEYLEFCETDG